MAKSPLEAFAKFNDLLEKRVKSTVELKGFADISEYIPTGNYLLNAQMSGSIFGGYPNTRSIGIAGDPGSGKTFLCLNAVRELQNMGYYVFYIDTEGAIDSIDFHKFGANLDQLKYYRMKMITDVKFFVDGLVKQKKESPEFKIALFVDSIGLLNSDKEVGDFEKGKSASDMGLKAKDLRAMFRSFTLDLSNERIPFIFTNHTYSGTDAYTGKAPGGGGGPEFAASIILMLSKGILRDDNKTSTGIIVRSKTRKNRLARPIEIEFHISHQKGMNPYVGLQDYTSWEGCGVGRGKKLTEKEFTKMKPEDQSDCERFEVGGEVFYFKSGKLAKNYILRHSGDLVPVEQFFTSKLFTDEVLHELDEKVMKPTFKYPETMDALMEEERAEILADEKEEVGDEL